ncbi:hypothetical protein Efla_004141 [Eimeria flavescens]
MREGPLHAALRGPGSSSGAPPPSSRCCAEAGVRELFARTDAYFSRVGLLPVLLPLPIHGDCGALKRGLLRSCILCSDHINSSLRRAALLQQQQQQQEQQQQQHQQQEQQQQEFAEGASLLPVGAPPSGVPSAQRVPLASSQSQTRCSSGGPRHAGEESPRGPCRDPVAEGLLPAKMMLEKLRLLAAELGDPNQLTWEGGALLTNEELGLPHIRRVLSCLDSSHAEGVLLLLCERRSAAVAEGPYRASLDTVLNATAAQLSERRELLQREQQEQPPLPDLGLGAVAGGLVTVAAFGQRQLKAFFCVEELPDDARHQLECSPREASLPCSFEGLPSGWAEFWAVSKRRFYATWSQRSSQLVPTDPANSLFEAFDLPLKFPDEAADLKPLAAVSSPSRRRGVGGNSRARRAAGRWGAPLAASSDAAFAEPSCEAASSSRNAAKGRARLRASTARLQHQQEQQQQQQGEQRQQQYPDERLEQQQQQPKQRRRLRREIFADSSCSATPASVFAAAAPAAAAVPPAVVSAAAAVGECTDTSKVACDANLFGGSSQRLLVKREGAASAS